MSAPNDLFSGFPNKYFIETGSCLGEGIAAAVKAGFPVIYSIEISEKYYKHCLERFKENSQVNLILGDSSEKLKEVLSKIDAPATFWLDAHDSEGKTCQSNYVIPNSPLIEELRLIGQHPIKNHTILIDDVEENSTNIENEILKINPNYLITYLKGAQPEGYIIVAQVCRLDVFIIWGHGLPYLKQILEKIRTFENKSFEILRCQYYDIKKPMSEFINDIYACDTVPLTHLIGKTRYLLETGTKIMVVVVKNVNPEEAMVGEGDFRHIQCKKVSRLKNSIRDEFNPKQSNGSRTENHVIHGTDYLSQSKYLLKYFDLEKPEFYVRNNFFPFCVPWYTNIVDYYFDNINPNSLYIQKYDNTIVLIENSPQMHCLRGNVQEYENYYEGGFGNQLIEYKTSKDLISLCDKYDPNLIINNKPSRPIIHPNLHISDGAHRVACAVFKKISTIPVIVIRDHIDLARVLGTNKRYAVIRVSPFISTPSVGSDIDILCETVDDMCWQILSNLRTNYKINVSKPMDLGRRHIDILLPNNTLFLRFDLIQKLNDYDIANPDELKEEVLNTKVLFNNIWIASTSMDVILRFLEYKKYPQKIQHAVCAVQYQQLDTTLKNKYKII